MYLWCVSPAHIKGHMKGFWFSASALYMVLLGAVSLRVPVNSQNKGPAYFAADVIHNALHVPAYMVLTFILFFTLRAFEVREEFLRWRVAFMALSYGILLEILQGLTPERDPSLLDVGLNLCGILLMLVLLRVITKSEKMKPSRG